MGTVPDIQVLAGRLLDEVAGYGRTLVAFSGGVDSSLVVVAAARALGTHNVVAATAVSPAVPGEEVSAAREFCRQHAVEHRLIATGEMDVAGYRENGPMRCYFCKDTLAGAARAFAGTHGFVTVATGTNASDVAGGFRPGIRAAARHGVRTPLADLGFAKDQVRQLARHWGLATWRKPATPCLSSRIAFGVVISTQRLSRVHRAETAVRAALAGAGLNDLRVRDLGDEVRLEVDAHLVGPAGADPAVARAVADAGFGDARLHVAAFRSGAMNDLLPDAQRWRHA
ncbi:asparagine synthase-related protein [Dactylosporangium sp. CA-092794]|uniref:asparagine synthase-related protein n=1 Tax=Dactylosporangium sp. CA-092794 TaxID=3239929 RepID=UPI003D9267A6